MLPRPLAMEMFLLGRRVTAGQLGALGAVNQVVAPQRVLGAAHSLADALAQGPRAAPGTIRHLVSSAYEAAETAQLDAECAAMARAAGGEEAGEGIAAFLEKRAPQFSG